MAEENICVRDGRAVVKHSLPILGFGMLAKGRFQSRLRRSAMAICYSLRGDPVSLSLAVFCLDSRLVEQETSLAFPTGALYEISGTSTGQTASGVSQWNRAVVCSGAGCSQATHVTMTGGDGGDPNGGSPDSKSCVYRPLWYASLLRCLARAVAGGCTVSWMLSANCMA